MTYRLATLTIVTVLLIQPARLFAEEAMSLTAAIQSISKDDLKRHVEVLADDALEGREAGTRGGYAAGKYLRNEFVRLKLKPAGEDGSFTQEFSSGYRNILGLMPGSDDKLRDEVIVICAHYDHVGYGSQRNSQGPIGFIHNGADDNASGSSAVIEIAEALSKLPAAPKRSVLFAFWDGEERGLLGSRHWAANPTIKLSRIKKVVNIDMLGRLRDSGLEVLGTRSAQGSRRLVAEQNVDTAIPLKFVWRTKANSDHFPFFERGFPYLLFHTGLHYDYHRPSDDVDKVNIVGLQKCSRLIFRTVHELANANELPKFRQAARYEALAAHQRHVQPLAPAPRRLGLWWNTQQPEGGLLVQHVNTDSPAERAGLLPGDRIIEFGTTKIEQGDREAAESFRSAVFVTDGKLPLRVVRQSTKDPLSLTVNLNGKPMRVGMAWRSDSAEPGIATVVRVIPGTPAAHAGLRLRDRIYTAAGESLTRTGQLAEILKRTTGSIDLAVERRGRIETITVEGIPALVVHAEGPKPQPSTEKPAS